MKRMLERIGAIYRLLVHNDQRGTVSERANGVAKDMKKTQKETKNAVQSLLEEITRNGRG